MNASKVDAIAQPVLCLSENTISKAHSYWSKADTEHRLWLHANKNRTLQLVYRWVT